MQKTQSEHRSHLGVYAFIPDAAGENILLILKGLGCYTGLYDLPGGRMDAHETLEDTLAHETREETLCEVTRHRQLGAYCVLYPHKDNDADVVLQHVGIVYLAEIAGTPTQAPAGGDSLGCVWVPVAGITAANSAPLVLQALSGWQDQK